MYTSICWHSTQLNIALYFQKVSNSSKQCWVIICSINLCSCKYSFLRSPPSCSVRLKVSLSPFCLLLALSSWQLLLNSDLVFFTFVPFGLCPFLSPASHGLVFTADPAALPSPQLIVWSLKGCGQLEGQHLKS